MDPAKMDRRLTKDEVRELREREAESINQNQSLKDAEADAIVRFLEGKKGTQNGPG